MQEVRAVVVARVVKECRLPVIQGLCKAAPAHIRLARHRERLLEIGLPGEDVAVAELRVAERDDLLHPGLHLARNGGPVAAFFILIVVRALDRLCLECLLDVLHAGECRLRRIHPRDPGLYAALIAIILALGDIIPQIAGIVHRII